jgi:hypothetical protein
MYHYPRPKNPTDDELRREAQWKAFLAEMDRKARIFNERLRQLPPRPLSAPYTTDEILWATDGLTETIRPSKSRKGGE